MPMQTFQPSIPENSVLKAKVAARDFISKMKRFRESAESLEMTKRAYLPKWYRAENQVVFSADVGPLKIALVNTDEVGLGWLSTVKLSYLGQAEVELRMAGVDKAKAAVLAFHSEESVGQLIAFFRRNSAMLFLVRKLEKEYKRFREEILGLRRRAGELLP